MGTHKLSLVTTDSLGLQNIRAAVRIREAYKRLKLYQL